MAARGTKRALDEPPVEEPEDEEPESSEESGDEPFAEGPASDLFSPSKEQAKSKPNLPQRVAYIDRPIMIAGELHETAVLCSLPHARAGALRIDCFSSPPASQARRSTSYKREQCWKYIACDVILGVGSQATPSLKVHRE